MFNIIARDALTVVNSEVRQTDVQDAVILNVCRGKYTEQLVAIIHVQLLGQCYSTMLLLLSKGIVIMYWPANLINEKSTLHLFDNSKLSSA